MSVSGPWRPPLYAEVLGLKEGLLEHRIARHSTGTLLRVIIVLCMSVSLDMGLSRVLALQL